MITILHGTTKVISKPKVVGVLALCGLKSNLGAWKHAPEVSEQLTATYSCITCRMNTPCAHIIVTGASRELYKRNKIKQKQNKYTD